VKVIRGGAAHVSVEETAEGVGTTSRVGMRSVLRLSIDYFMAELNKK